MADETLFKLNRSMTMGADPELFVFAGSKVLPAFEFLTPAPKKMTSASVYWDGFQAEMAEPYGHGCLEGLSAGIRHGLNAVLVSARMKESKARLTLQSVVKISRLVLKEAKEEHVVFGCNPSKNVYGIAGQGIENPREMPHRFAGGHIHCGFTSSEPKPEPIIKLLDKILGVWSVGAAANFDVPVRRLYYGLAGEYRTKVYRKANQTYQGEPMQCGIEYRTLSNFWLCHPQIYMAVFEMARMICHWAIFNPEANEVWAGEERETIECIQECDVKLARRILKRNAPLFHSMWRHSSFARSDWPGWDNPKLAPTMGGKVPNLTPIGGTSQFAFDIAMNGIESVVPDPDDIENNWSLKTINLGWRAPHFRNMPADYAKHVAAMDKAKKLAKIDVRAEAK